MVNENFYSQLRDSFGRDLAAPFLTTPPTTPTAKSWTYGEIDELSARFAAALLGTGAKPGDRLVVQVEKSPENVALYLASLRAGLVYVPLNTAYTPGEVAYFLEDAAPTLFVCAPDKKDLLAEKISSAVRVLTLGAKGDGALMDAAKKCAPHEKIEPRYKDDLASILYTSGTTGRSKGAMLSHGALSTNARTLARIWGFEKSDILLHALPIYHIHGLFVALHTAMLSGCEVRFLPKFDVDLVRSLLPWSTVMMGVPTFYSRLLDNAEFNKEDCASIRLFISGSAPLTAENFMAFEKRTGHQILERYGMSEAGMIASNPADGDRIAGTVGFPLPGVEVQILDSSRMPAERGEQGVVAVKGPGLFKGYWRMPEKTKEEFTDDGWFITGDIGIVDDTGRVSLIGREKDLIISGGLNIYPKEIEELLDAAPAISESAVIAAPHKDMGEGVVAVLVAANPDEKSPLDEAGLSKLVAALARFKQPRRFYWVDALPRNAMGKVQKQVLREQFKDAFQ